MKLLLLLLTLSPFLYGESTIIGFSSPNYSDCLVVTLQDGSSWESHPKDQKTIARWQPGESVDIYVKICSAKHQFIVKNLTRNEMIRTTIVDYGEHSLTVSEIIDIYQNGYYSEYVSTYCYCGRSHNEYVSFPKYALKLLISNGQTLTMDIDFKQFTLTPGTPLYIGKNINGTFFVVTGLGSNAEYAWL
ncbi:MAG: hypothetical protein S4CHLAM45_13230 [Chlamydiales bacterium]|nr:hypothetical protein [Chlamydiales bacterium]MCH9619812.1 hypothetical protein [Chlamydiales bacterium]MCH9623418.1 hypothetical protein [Chlamydiales bacterium]